MKEMDFENFHSWGELQETVAFLRNSGKRVTNFFGDEARMSRWIEARCFRRLLLPGGALFLHDRGESRQIWFFADAESIAGELVAMARRGETVPWVMDVIQTSGTGQPLEQSLCQVGCRIYRRLSRMSRVVPAVGHSPALAENDSPEVRLATENDIPELRRLFTQYFDPLAEQIPDEMELRDWVDKSCIRVIPGGKGPFAGFVIVEAFPKMSYLRYWFVHPEFREKGIGRSLLTPFLNPPAEVRRQILWVLDDNENAIKRYIHYGFRKDPLQDTIYLLT